MAPWWRQTRGGRKSLWAGCKCCIMMDGSWLVRWMSAVTRVLPVQGQRHRQSGGVIRFECCDAYTISARKNWPAALRTGTWSVGDHWLASARNRNKGAIFMHEHIVQAEYVHFCVLLLGLACSGRQKQSSENTIFVCFCKRTNLYNVYFSLSIQNDHIITAYGFMLDFNICLYKLKFTLKCIIIIKDPSIWALRCDNRKLGQCRNNE
jgi:hypothetical protein